MKKNDDRLKKLLFQIRRNEPSLDKELEKKRNDPELREEANVLSKSLKVATDEEGFEVFDTSFATESIILRVGRPVLTILNNEAQLAFDEIESEIWRSKLEVASQNVGAAIRSVGRIELQYHPRMDWVGTGWLVGESVVVTNRHVAEVFARSDGHGFVFRQGINDRRMTSRIDLLEEVDGTGELQFDLTSILHIEAEPGPDMAFLRVAKRSGDNGLPSPISLAASVPMDLFDVAVIGYPARDSRIPEQDLMEKLFDGVYNKKRLAPGQVTGANGNRIFHDCSTLGGCSGSPLIDLKTGLAVGLHFAGRFLESNYAIPASLIAERLRVLSRNEGGNTRARGSESSSVTGTSRSPETLQISHTVLNNAGSQVTIPLTITLGQPASSSQVVTGISVKREDDDIIEDFETEARPEDYDDREGYKPDFLNEGVDAPLPVVPLPVFKESKQRDVLKFGDGEQVLRYEHFSVVMSKSRRMCFFSAVNINGKRSREKVARVSWRMDPRIPKGAQILKECYGSPPKFSRGHMTRREDPIWGKEEEAFRGNADSMHVTNATPQMQSFNAPVWLALEDHALHNARADKMRISVFTGPIFKSNDPVYYRVKVPMTFWKVIAFIHDETEELCATGYRMSQKDHLPEEEFVFGEFDASQVSIASIESAAGLSFGRLREFDPLHSENESFANTIPLHTVGQIKFH